MRPVRLRDAILRRVGSNATHGVRRSNADKYRAVMTLLQDEDWRSRTDREIARCCAGDHTFVGRLRASMVLNTSGVAPRTYRDRHGNVSQMNTARIGRQATAPASAKPPVQPELPPAENAGNVVVLGSRPAIMPSSGAVERDQLADEATPQVAGATDYLR